MRIGRERASRHRRSVRSHAWLRALGHRRRCAAARATRRRCRRPRTRARSGPGRRRRRDHAELVARLVLDARQRLERGHLDPQPAVELLGAGRGRAQASPAGRTGAPAACGAPPAPAPAPRSDARAATTAMAIARRRRGRSRGGRRRPAAGSAERRGARAGHAGLAASRGRGRRSCRLQALEHAELGAAGPRVTARSPRDRGGDRRGLELDEAAASSARNARFTTRSSPEWKEMTPRRPPPLEQSAAACGSASRSALGLVVHGHAHRLEGAGGDMRCGATTPRGAPRASPPRPDRRWSSAGSGGRRSTMRLRDAPRVRLLAVLEEDARPARPPAACRAAPPRCGLRVGSKRMSSGSSPWKVNPRRDAVELVRGQPEIERAPRRRLASRPRRRRRERVAGSCRGASTARSPKRAEPRRPRWASASASPSMPSRRAPGALVVQQPLGVSAECRRCRPPPSPRGGRAGGCVTSSARTGQVDGGELHRGHTPFCATRVKRSPSGSRCSPGDADQRTRAPDLEVRRACRSRRTSLSSAAALAVVRQRAGCGPARRAPRPAPARDTRTGSLRAIGRRASASPATFASISRHVGERVHLEECPMGTITSLSPRPPSSSLPKLRRDAETPLRVDRVPEMSAKHSLPGPSAPRPPSKWALTPLHGKFAPLAGGILRTGRMGVKEKLGV